MSAFLISILLVLNLELLETGIFQQVRGEKFTTSMRQLVG